MTEYTIRICPEDNPRPDCPYKSQQGCLASHQARNGHDDIPGCCYQPLTLTPLTIEEGIKERRP